MTSLPFVVHDEEVAEQAFEWGTLRWLCNAQLAAGAQQTVGLCQIHPGRINPLHFHPNCEEVLHVLSGVGQHSYDGQRVFLRAGSTIRIPAGVQHNLENSGTELLVCLICFSSGHRETVFLE